MGAALDGGFAYHMTSPNPDSSTPQIEVVQAGAGVSECETTMPIATRCGLCYGDRETKGVSYVVSSSLQPLLKIC
jgi:hypothetical protein